MKRFISVAIMGLAVMAFTTAEGRAASDASRDSAKPAAGGQERQLDPNLPGVGDQDQEFAYTAHAMLMPLVEMSRLGVEKAKDPELVDLSRQMADEYADLAKDLEQAAQAAGIEASKGEAPHGENRLNRLQVSGDGFDLAYVIEQQGLHEKLVAIYTMEARAEKDDPLSEHAQDGRKLLADNMDKIESMQAQLRKERTSPTR